MNEATWRAKISESERVLLGGSAGGSSIPNWSGLIEPTTRATTDDRAASRGPVAELMRREQRYRLLLALADALAVLLALALVPVALGRQVPALAFAGPVLLVAVAKVQGLYDRDERVVRKSTLAEWRTIVGACSVVSLVIAVSWRLSTQSHPRVGIWLFIFLTGVMAGSAVVFRVIGRLIARASSPHDRVLVVGGTSDAGELVPVLSGLRGVEVAGGVPLIRDGWSRPELEQVIARFHAHRLVLVPDVGSSSDGLVETIRSAKEIGVRVSIFPSVLASIGRATTIDDVNGLPLLGVAPFGLSRSSRILKRGLDIAVACVLLSFLWPLMLVVAVWIRIDSPGPALFRQVRVGRDGRPFRMIKFRSMVDGADGLKADLLASNEAVGGLFKIALDPRVTNIGRLLRRTHLDELPQLLNVMRGEMSLVGPRPLIEEEDALLCGRDRCRLRLTPGMTGPWQIRGPMTTPLSEMAKLDYLYISNWSLWRDIEILLRTVPRMTRLGGQ